MIRTLLTTTALAALLTGGAMAQATTTATPAPGAFGAYTATDSDNLATEIIGKQVYASAAAEAYTCLPMISVARLSLSVTV